MKTIILIFALTVTTYAQARTITTYGSHQRFYNRMCDIFGQSRSSKFFAESSAKQNCSSLGGKITNVRTRGDCDNVSAGCVCEAESEVTCEINY